MTWHRRTACTDLAPPAGPAGSARGWARRGPAAVARALGIALLVSVAGCSRPPAVPADPGLVGGPEVPADATPASVERVVDGDTLMLRMAFGGLERVRVIGFDSPETVKPDTPVACFGPQASTLAHRLLPPASQVLVRGEPGGDRDAYGRLLRDVWLPDGRLMAAVMIAAGAARAYPVRPQVTFAADLAALQRQAQARGAGLWGSPCHGQSFAGRTTRSRAP